MDVVGRMGYFLQQVMKFIPPVGVHFDLAAIKQRGLVAVRQQGGQRLIGCRDGTNILRQFTLFGPLRDAFIGMPGDDALFPVVLPEEEIKYQSYSGCKQEHDNPRNGLERIAVFGDNHQNQTYYRDAV